MQFYYVDKNNQQQGPVSREGLAQCGCTPTTLVWHEGMTSWLPAGEVPELAGMFPPVPPVAQAATPPTPPVPAAPVAPAPVAEPAVNRFEELEEEPKPKSRMPVIICAVIACIAAAAGAYFTFNGGQSDGNDDVALTDTMAAPVDSVPVEGDTAFVAHLTTKQVQQTSYFIADNDDEDNPNVYLTKFIELQWPNEANFNITPLCEAMNYCMFKKRVEDPKVAAKGFLSRGDEDGDGMLNWRPNKTSVHEGTGDNAYAWNWSTDVSCVQVSEKLPVNMVAFSMYGSEYTGGAHGMPYMYGTVNYDCQLGQAVAYADIFKPGSDKKILQLIISARRKMKEYDADYGSEPNRIPKETMLILEKSISFTYGAYEIAPYAEGMPEIFLKLEQIKPYLNEYGLEIYSRELPKQ